jgi:YHS domain-containing protein
MMTRDHVCDCDVDEEKAAACSEYEGDIYYFHSAECKAKFDADPERYVSRAESSQT